MNEYVLAKVPRMQDFIDLITGFDKAPQTKAVIKHDIKLLEVKIQHEINNLSSFDQLLPLVKQVCYKYHSLHCLTKASLVDEPAKAQAIVAEYPHEFDKILLFWQTSVFPDSSLVSIESELKQLKQAWTVCIEPKQELSLIEGILQLYVLLYQELSLTQTASTRAQKVVNNDCADIEQPFGFMRSNEVTICLNGIIDLFNLDQKIYFDVERKFEQINAQYQFDDAQVLQTYLLFFEQTEILTLNNQLFVLAQQPQALFEQKVHVSKLISVSSRLNLLQSCLVALYRYFKRLATKHSLKISKDWLMPSTTLPSGIEVEVKQEYREFIYAAVKKINAFSKQQDEYYWLKYRDMISSFVFWFNPTRFVDAIWAIKQHAMTENHISCDLKGREVACDWFVQQFSQLPTHECINLYGYFTDKTLNYLMHTLKALSQGQQFDWLTSLDNNQQQLLAQIYSYCEQVMTALRQELDKRDINNQAYAYQKPKFTVSPGKRIKECIIHILNVYHNQAQSNTDLSSLFDRLEQTPQEPIA